MRRGRREQVATVEGSRDRRERIRRVGELAGLDDAGTVRGREQQPVIGPDVMTPFRITHDERPPVAADAGVDDGQMDADGHVRKGVREHERSLEDGLGRDPVGDVDDSRLGRDPQDDAVAGADEVVLEPEVAEEGDDHRVYAQSTTLRAGP